MMLLYPRDFKVHACTITSQHDERTCFFHHNISDRRRDTVDNYLPITCHGYHKKACEVGCKHGDACMYTHSPYEIRYHPLQFKTRLCPYAYESTCTNRICFYAHSLEELVEIDASYLCSPDETMREMIEKFKFFQMKSSEKYANEAANRILTTLRAM